MLIRHWVKINCFFVKYWKVSVLKSAKVKALLWVHQLRFSLEQLNLKNKAVQKVLALLTHSAPCRLGARGENTNLNPAVLELHLVIFSSYLSAMKRFWQSCHPHWKSEQQTWITGVYSMCLTLALYWFINIWHGFLFSLLWFSIDYSCMYAHVPKSVLV